MNVNAYPIRYRFSWRGKVDRAKEPGHFVMEEEFLTLVGRFGLAPRLQDRTIGLEG
jgi:hypothetical protein